MTRSGSVSFLICLVLCLTHAPAALGVEPGQGADFREVYELIRSNVAGVSDAELDQAAIEGLLTALGSKVSLVTNTAADPGAASTSPVSQAGIYDDGIAYVRVSRVSEGLAGEVQSRYWQLGSTNRLKGVVLDLRYANGTDYAAAAAAADLFVSKAQPLLNWGAGMVLAEDKTNAIGVPVAILVNGETAGAAEALAAVLRETGAGLLLGSRTAGRAMTTRDFPLRSGAELRIATAPVTLGDGKGISSEGLKPDIEIAIDAERERDYYADPYFLPEGTNLVADASRAGDGQTNGATASRRVRFNEAELVRERRQGTNFGMESQPPRAPEPELAVVRDPALARGIDLLKGLAIVRRPRP